MNNIEKYKLTNKILNAAGKGLSITAIIAMVFGLVTPTSAILLFVIGVIITSFTYGALDVYNQF